MNSNLWFATYDERYEGSEPFFYDTEKIEVAQALEKNYATIKNELKILWENRGEGQMKVYGDDALQIPPKTWSKMVFKVWGIKNKKVCEKFPATYSLMKKFPGVTSSFVTKTSAHSVIRPHCGETNATIRIHLGLHVKDEDPQVCGMQVGNEIVSWKNGKTFAFLDAHYHHVWNKSE